MSSFRTLDDLGDNDHGKGLGRASHRRGGHENDEAAEVHRPSAYHVRQAAHRHKHRGGAQNVAQGYPLHRGDIGGETVGDAR